MQIIIDRENRQPVYTQIVDQVSSLVEAGLLPPDTKLPTVRELADSLDIARGTVKHAYDELEKRGVIRMIQGRGTFVHGRRDRPLGKKERAMQAIGNLFEELSGLGFSPQEIRIFLSLKLRELEELGEGILIFIVDCNPEALSMLESRLSSQPDIDIYRMSLEEALRSPENFAEQADLIVTTETHYAQLRAVMQNPDRLMQVVMTPTHETILDLAKLEQARIGVVCTSERFSQIVRRGCETLGMPVEAEDIFLFGGEDLSGFLADKDAVILPPNYLRFCNATEGTILTGARESGKVFVPYEYQLDGGSLLMFKERIATIRRQKNRMLG